MPGEAIAQMFLEVVCHAVGRVLLPIVTLGYVRAEPWDRKRGIRFRWHGVHRLPNGKIIVQDDLAALIGLLMVAAVIAIGLFGYFSFGR